MKHKNILDNIYNDKILDWAANIAPFEPLANYDAYICETTLICGAKIELYIASENNIIKNYSQKISACLIGQAMAALLAKHAVSLSFAEAKELAIKVKKMLETGKADFPAKFKDFAYFLPISQMPNKYEVAWLSFKALLQCIKIIEEKGQNVREK